MEGGITPLHNIPMFLSPPEWFVDALDRECHGKFRIRWSPAKLRWQIEEKMARRRMPDRLITINDDEKIREFDGYELFAEVTPGSKLKCDRCHHWVHAAEQKFKTTRCSHCQKEHKAFFWVLGEGLLEHLKKVNPLTGGIDRVFKEVDQKTVDRSVSNRRANRNYGEAAGKDSFNFIHDIQSVGYTGKNRKNIIHRDKGLK